MVFSSGLLFVRPGALGGCHRVDPKHAMCVGDEESLNSVTQFNVLTMTVLLPVGRDKGGNRQLQSLDCRFGVKPGKRLLSAKDMGSVMVSIRRGEGCWGERLGQRFQGWSTLGIQKG